MITAADDYPLHQTSRPFRDPGTDRNLYDRFFFCGYRQPGDDTEGYFAAAFGMYPGRNVMDAAFSVQVGGVQHNVRGSRLLGDDRLHLTVGPVTVHIEEPLHRIRLTVADVGSGVSADLLFTSRGPAFEEPHYRWAPGRVTTFDITRMTQNGTWSGWIETPSGRIEVTPDRWWGTRDRSWGIRPVGARDTSAAPDGPPPSFYWLWGPMNFPDMNVIIDVNENPDGSRWHENAAVAQVGTKAMELETSVGTFTYEIDWKPGTRHASGFVAAITTPSSTHTFRLRARSTFFMSGIGYGHPKWGHGMYVGTDEATSDALDLSSVDEADPLYNHVQILCDIERNDGVVGTGILEMAINGPHTPSGFTGYTDMRP